MSSHRRGLQLVCRAVALFAIGMVAFNAWAMLSPSLDRAGAAATAGVAQVVTPGVSGGALLPSGGTATEFTLKLPEGAACSGDGVAGYRVQSYMVTSAVEPASLTFPLSGGLGASFSQPLYKTNASSYVDDLPDPSTGKILNIPTFKFSGFAAGEVFSPGDIPAGVYNAGVACTLGDAGPTQLDKFWNVQLTFTADEADALDVVWAAANETGLPGSTTTSTSSTSTSSTSSTSSTTSTSSTSTTSTSTTSTASTSTTSTSTTTIPTGDMTVTPTSGPPGTDITLTATTSCPPPTGAEDPGVVGVLVDSDLHVVAADVEPLTSAGTWTLTIKVPDVEPGTYAIGAACFPDVDALEPTPYQTYEVAKFTVTAGASSGTSTTSTSAPPAAEVLGSQISTPSASSFSGELPFTGGRVNALLIWASLFLIFGRAAILLGRTVDVRTETLT